MDDNQLYKNYMMQQLKYTLDFIEFYHQPGKENHLLEIALK